MEQKTLVIATTNEGKLLEIKSMLPHYRLLYLKDIGYDKEIPEPFDTFEENAAIKAQTIHNFCGLNVLAEDSGICVDALKGEPGVNSAHYSGSRDSGKNVQKLLQNMEGVAHRDAAYHAVICLIWRGNTYFYNGKCAGSIAYTPQGNGGFGYDPIFIPQQYDKTFGELPLSVKNSLSHRGQALAKMLAFLATFA
ncbi:MAG: RdgB/HAM1 family non-canonical purine NTP pyrophosphatase [Chitinophagia bacterium]|nr:RdgB/HAM1 family non-canonical purine NTP pyrophosphatase [Chitinophagia bacterium]